MNFATKEELEQRYFVKASFYKRDNFLFRNYADIIRKGYEDALVDVYIIMMNPGSCKPLCDDFIGADSPQSAVFVDAISDRAQKRVM